MYNILFQPITEIVPMKEAAKKALGRLGLHCLRDLLFHKPSGYNIIDTSSDFANLSDGKLVQIEVTIGEILHPPSRRAPMKIYTSNESGELMLFFFNKIPGFIYNRLKIGSKCIVVGKVQFADGMWRMTHPDFVFNKASVSAVEPVYPLTYGIINKQLGSYIISAIKAFENAIKARAEFGSESKDQQEYMARLLIHIKQIHLLDAKPNPMLIEQSIEESTESLSASELFANQVSLAKLKSKEKAVLGNNFDIFSEIKQKVLDRLGFELTDAQSSAIEEIEKDQLSGHQMMRLLQGDVGSGKTLVALLTMINVAKSGHQSALMVPTDLLSAQHYQFITHALEGTGITPALLTGKSKAKERRAVQEGLKNGEIDILIGTHALFQSSVEFAKLGYVIIDEQHRFGVEQRLELIGKASNPDVLVMTATPIPRSLTLTMFGDMSVSQVKAKPKNRLPIVTTIISNDKKNQVIESLGKKLAIGEKIYWVCPLIDKSDKTIELEEDAVYADVTERAAELEGAYPGVVAILHGKMKAADKEAVMQKFKDGEIKILVATTVIEVGIDVSDATLIILDNAEKFGLAQLHQLRGRVGRGSLQSYCMLMYNPKRLSTMARKRLEIMRNSSDGFYISEQDLLLRGGGEILGTKQSGEPEFFFADLGRDLEILLKANKLTTSVIASELVDFQIRLFAREREELSKSG